MKKFKQGSERWALQKVFAGMMGDQDLSATSRFYAAGSVLQGLDDQGAVLHLYTLPIGGGMIANCEVYAQEKPLDISINDEGTLNPSSYSDVIKLDMDEVIVGAGSERAFSKSKHYLDLMDDLLLSLHRNDSGDLGLDESLYPSAREHLIKTSQIEMSSAGRYRITQKGALAYLSYLSFKVSAGAETYDNVQRRLDFLIQDETPTGPSQNWSFDTIPMFVPEFEQMPLAERMEEVRTKVDRTFNGSPEFSM